MSQELKILEFAVVVVAEAHNPTVLHPFFMEANKIAPEAWKSIPGQCATTPMFAVIQYVGGVQFLVEPHRLIATDSQPGDIGHAERLAGVVQRYVEALPHVAYQAVGLNFTAFKPMPEPERYMLEWFLPKRRWAVEGGRLASCQTTLRFSVGAGTLNMTFEAGKATDQGAGREVEGVFARANYHADIPQEPVENVLPECVARIATAKDVWAHFLRNAAEILGGGIEP